MKVTELVSAEDMAAAIGKVGTVASQTGMSMNKLNAITATLTGAMGLSGSEIGTMEKTLLSRIFRIGSEGEEDAGASEKALNDLGIAVRKSSTEFRDSEKIIDEVAAKYKSLTNVQQTNLAQVLGGTYHYAKVMALLSNYDTVIDANVKALNSQGSAYRENMKYLESMTGKLNILKNTVESKYDQFLSSDILIGFISGLTTVIERLGNFESVLIKIGIALAVWKGNALLDFFKLLPAQIQLSSLSLIQARGALAGYTVAQTTAMASTTGLIRVFNALKVAFLSNPFGIVALSVVGLVTAFELFNKTEDETKRVIKESNDAFEARQQSIKSLTEAYKQNSELSKTDDNAKKNLIDTEKQLKEALGENGKALDLQNGKLEDNISLIQKVSQEQLKAYIDQNKLRVEDLQNAQNEKGGKNFGQGLFSSNTKSLSIASQELGFSNNLDITGKYTLSQKEYEKVLDQIIKKQDELISKGVKKDFIKDIVTEYEKVKKTTDEVDVQIKKLNDSQKQYVENGITGLSQLSESQKKIFDMSKEGLKFDNAEQYKNQIIQVSDAVKSFNGKNLDDVKNKLSNLFPDDVVNNILTSLSKASDGFYITGKSAEEVEKAQKKLDEQYKESINNIQLLQKAQNELNQDHKFSETTLEGLINKYGGLLDTQKSEEEILKDIQKLVEQEGKTFTDIATAKIMMNQHFFESAIKGNSNLWTEVAKAYGDDLSNFSNIEEAKLKIDEFITKEIANNWSTLSEMQRNILEESSALLGEITSKTEQSFDDNFTAMQAMAKVQGISGKTDEEMGAIVESGAFKRIDAMKNAFGKMKEIAVNAAKNLKSSTMDLGSIKDKSGSSGGSTPTVNEESYKVESDRYLALNQVLNNVNNALEKNQSLKKRSNDSENLKLLNEEVDLLKQKRLAINNIAYEQQQEANDKRKFLEDNNVKFDEKGNINKASYDFIIDSISSETESMKRKGNSKIIAENNQLLKNLEQANKDYISATQNAAKSLNERESLTGDILATMNDLDKLNVDIILKNQERNIESYEKILSELESEYDDFADNQSQEKFNNFQKQIELEKDSIEELQAQIEELGKTWWKVVTQQQKDFVHEEAEKKRAKISTIQKSTTKKENENFNRRIDMFSQDTYQYDDGISNVREKGELIQPFKIVGEDYEDFSEKIKNTSEEILIHQDKIKYLKEALEGLNFTTSENAKQEETRQKAIKDVIKELNREELITSKLTSSISDMTSKREEQAKNLARRLIQIEKDTQDEILSQKEQNLSRENELKDREFYNKSKILEEKERQQERYMSGAEKTITLTGIQTDLLNFNSEQVSLGNKQLDIFNSQISAMQSMSELKRSDLTLLQKNIELEKEKLALSNMQNEKTIKVLKKDSSGKFNWQWEADTKSVNEKKNRINELQLDLEKYQQDQILNNERQNLEDEKRMWDEQQRYKSISLSDERFTFENHYKNLDVLAEDSFLNLKEKYGSHWDELIKELQSRVRIAEAEYSKLLGGKGISISSSASIVSGNSSSSSSSISGAVTASDVTVASKPKAGILPWLRDEGGRLPSNQTAINKSGQDEYILNPSQTEDWHILVNKFLPLLPSTMNSMNNIMAGLKISTPNIPISNNNNTNTATNHDESINIEKVEIKANSVDGFINGLKRKVRSS